MHTKFSRRLSLQGYITTRLSSPYHIESALGYWTSGAVRASASATLRGMRNLKAAFPELKSGASLMYFLVVDYTGELVLLLFHMNGAPDSLWHTYIPSAPTIMSARTTVPSPRVIDPVAGSNLTTLLEV